MIGRLDCTEYAAALQEYLAGNQKRSLDRAAAAVRSIVAGSQGLRWLTATHQNVLTEALQLASDGMREAILERAAVCLARSLSPCICETNDWPARDRGGSETVEAQLRRHNEELMAAHHSIEHERSRYQELFDFAPDAYFVTGMEGAIWEANTAAAALLRMPQELLRGQSLHEFVGEAYRSEFRGRLHALHAGAIEKVEDWEIALVPRHGAAMPAAVTVVAERAVPAPMAGLRWLLRDVTERKRLEHERTRWLLSRAKAKAARRFKFLAEASALLVGPQDVEASLASVARLAASFLRGWCFISIVEPGGALRQLEAAPPSPEFEEVSEKLRAHSLFDGKTEGLPEAPCQIEAHLTEWYDRVADSPAHAGLLRQTTGRMATILPLRLHERLVGLMMLVRTLASRPNNAANRALEEDLARRCALALENARLYRELVAQRDKAEIASRTKSEFVAVLGHELRNPLTPIVGWTRRLKRYPAIAEDPTLAEGLLVMEKNALVLTRLADDCADLTRISEGKFRIEHGLVDMNQVVTAAAEGIRGMASERGLSLRIELAPVPVAVEGDAIRLEQVLANLLTNAVKYTENGGRISIRTAAFGEYTEVEITDTGIGIEPEYLDQIFEPFRRGAASWLTSRSGLGLGLSIVRRIVETHGGRVWAESTGLGCGSTFRVRLPRAAQAISTRPAGASAECAQAVTKRLRILFVEDSADIVFLVKTGLESLGHIVVNASNGRAALQMIQADTPDLLISDIKMPFMDGYELIRTIRREPAFHATPAIALTGFGAKAEIERARAAGFDLCLTKPAETEQIAAAIRELAERG